MQQQTFAEVEDTIRVGDVLAFGGDGLLSRIIKKAVGGPVSHAATVIAVEPRPLLLIESTVRLALHPTFGVSEAPAADIVRAYPGDVWLLPLAGTVRAQRFDEPRFVSHLRGKVGGTFDVIGGLRVILDDLLTRIHTLGVVDLAARFESFFCTELVAGALREARVAPDIAPEWVSPRDLCRWNIYGDTYYQLRAARAGVEIPDYNTTEPRDTLAPVAEITAGLRQATHEALVGLR